MEFTDEELQAYHEALDARVCSLCRAHGYEDSCRIGEDGLCPIDTHLRDIVEAVLSTPRSEHAGDYLPAIRARVCAHCARQDREGQCRARALAECGLDSFVLEAVTAIEEIHDQSRACVAV